LNTRIIISLTGPESAGKTTLAQILGEFFHWPVVTEYARQFLSSGGGVHTVNDLVRLAHHQIESENLARRSLSNGIICDTDMLVFKIWCLEKFNRVPNDLSALCKHHRYDLTLLCKPDMPWQPDPFREHPLDRDRLFYRYLAEAENLKTNFKIIEGQGEQRTRLAIKIVEEYLKHH
jgi:nicotinamide riboside kinase